MKRRFLLLGFLVVLLAGLVPTAQPVSAGPPSGWVKADVVGGGCDSAGHCNSDVRPGSPTLYEFKPDRQPVGRDFNIGADLSQHGGFPSYEPREKCNINGTDHYWSAGMWHHGGFWTLTYDASGREQWSGPVRQHWAFEHNDVCQPLPTPIPTSTPTSTATPRPGETPPPPPPATLTPTTVPSPTPDPQCIGSAGRFDERSSLPIYVARQDDPDTVLVPQRAYAWDELVPNPSGSGEVPIWQAYPRLPASNIPPAFPPYDLPGGPGRVSYTRPVLVTYDWPALEYDAGPVLNKGAYAADHAGQSEVFFGLRDDTTGEVLAAVGTNNVRLTDSSGEPVMDGYTLRLRDSSTFSSKVSFVGPMLYERWDTTHAAWEGPPNGTSYRPDPKRNIRRLGQSGLVFMPEKDHTYTAWTWAGHGACRVEAPRWVVVRFTAQDWQDDPPPTTTATSTVTPSPTPTATPTPTPPPPPMPNASFKLTIHSTLDPNSNDSDPTNGVYKSESERIAWPAGEVLDFTPRVQIILNPSAPAYPGYRFQAHVQDWSFVSSVGQVAAVTPDGMGRAGCRGTARMTNGVSGPVCTYDYIGGTSLTDRTEPTEADMANQAHVYWAIGKPHSMRPDVHVHNLSQLNGVDLKVEVRIVVEVLNVSTGNIVRSDTRTVSGTFGVSMVVPRSVK